MKKIVTAIVITSVVFFTFSAFDYKHEMPSSTIAEKQKVRLDSFIHSLNKTLEIANELSVNNLEILRSSFLKTRLAYKKWEYIAEYLDPAFVKKYINGAPLPKQEENSFGPFVVAPSGLQILDEIIFADDAVSHKSKITSLLKDMVDILNIYKVTIHPVYDRVVLEAARVELIRMYTLGLTGFDVPASGNSITDAIVVLETVIQDLSLYKDFFSKVNPALYNEVMVVFKDYKNYLVEHNDFDTLDRLVVLKSFVNPLFSKILILHKESQIEMIQEVVPSIYLPPYNNLSNNLFSTDFLDIYGYTALPKELNSPELIALGKILFFDPVLSGNNKRACASCHDPKKGFTDGVPKSVSLDFKGTVGRNSPTLINCVYSKKFFHDMRANALEDQIEHVLTSKKEFGTSMLEILEKLQKSDEYVAMFDNCFKEPAGKTLNARSVAFAVSAYVSSLRSYNSKFDKYVRGETDNINPAIARGYNLFMGKAVCGTCHFAPNFNGTVPPLYNDSESEVLGVPENPYTKKPILDEDKGRYAARIKEPMYFYEYSFKTPTIRNIEITAPYMHNGSYKTLEDVLDFYNNGGGEGIGIVIEHQTLPFDSLSLNKNEVCDIITFMKSLTDTINLTSVPIRLPKFADPLLDKRKIGGEY